MELNLREDDEHYYVGITLTIDEVGVKHSSFTMTDEINLPKAQCRSEKELLLLVEGAVSHMSLRLVNQFRRPLMSSLREGVLSAVRQAVAAPTRGHGDAAGQGAATTVAEGVVPTPPRAPEGSSYKNPRNVGFNQDEPCPHDVIYAPNDGALFGKCVRCNTAEIPVTGYGQSAMMNEGFLTRLRVD